MPIPVVDEFGTIRWYNEEGDLHREDGPAIKRANGDKFWYKNGKLHRDHGPAIECNYGEQAWYQYGKLHRIDGPAVDRIDGYKEYWINGTQYLSLEEGLMDNALG